MISVLSLSISSKKISSQSTEILCDYILFSEISRRLHLKVHNKKSLNVFCIYWNGKAGQIHIFKQVKKISTSQNEYTHFIPFVSRSVLRSTARILYC